MKYICKTFFTSASVCALSMATPALAQQPEGAEAAAGGDGAIGEIVVTARRHEEALQDVPIAITALSGDDLVRRGVDSVDGLRNVTPGLNIGGLARDDATLFLRGQGPGPAGTARSSPGVATYFAEVPTQLAGSGELFDLQNVQVLKGPQGTLFGRSTTGGAVLFEPHRPTSEFEGYVEVSGGNHGFYEFEGMINAPIKPDEIELRIAGQFSRRKGFTQSIITGQKLDDRNFESVRASLLLKPSDRFENLTTVTYRAQDGAGSSQVLLAVNPAAPLGGSVPTPPALAPIFGLPAGTSGSIPIRAGGTVNIACAQVQLPGCPTGPFGFQVAALQAAFNGGNTSSPSNSGFYLIAPTSAFEQYMATQLEIGPRKVQIPEILRKKRLNFGVTNKTTFDVTDNITLKNIFGYRYSRTNESLDYDGTPLRVGFLSYNNGQQWQSGYEQISEEFQIQGRAPSANLDYILGYYYEQSKPGFNQYTLGYFVNQPNQATYRDYRDTSNAVYAHLEWKPLDILGLSGGIRKTWDSRSQSLSQTTQAGTCNLVDQSTGQFTCPITYDADFSAVTYDVTASVTPVRGLMGYVSYRKGYKTGGFNLPAPVAPGPNPGAYQTFGPETVYSWEAGIKADWNIGIPVRTNLSVFSNDYKDIQTGIAALTAQGQAVQIILNVAKAKQKGFEFDTTIQPFKQLQLSGFVSYLDSHPTENVIGPDGTLAVKAGRQSSNSPKWKYGISGVLTLPVPEDYGTVDLSADWSWTGVRNTPNIVTMVPTYPSYGVLNARLEWNDIFRKGVDVSVFANNLLDKAYIFGGYPLGNYGAEAAIYGEPAMYGVSVKFRFGN